MALKPLKPSKQKRKDKKHQQQEQSAQPPIQIEQPKRRPMCKVLNFPD